MRPVPQRGTGGARGGALYYKRKGFLQSSRFNTFTTQGIRIRKFFTAEDEGYPAWMQAGGLGS
jgi:hypothetical protein